MRHQFSSTKEPVHKHAGDKHPGHIEQNQHYSVLSTQNYLPTNSRPLNGVAQGIGTLAIRKGQ